jgi:hypothetical protein
MRGSHFHPYVCGGEERKGGGKPREVGKREGGRGRLQREEGEEEDLIIIDKPDLETCRLNKIQKPVRGPIRFT